MNELKKWSLQKKAKKAVDILNGRQFDAHYAENAEEARKLVGKQCFRTVLRLLSEVA